MFKERIAVRESPSLPGIEVFDAINSAQRFQWFHTAFGIGVPIDWQGQVRYRGQKETVGPGGLLCTTPGEVHTMTRIDRVGTFSALMIDADVFSAHAQEHGVHGSSLAWRTDRVSSSRRVVRRVVELLRTFDPTTSPLEIESRFVHAFEAIVQELVTGRQRVPAGVAAWQVRRMREILHSTEGNQMDLESLAAQVGMSRYQALRAFKSRYGIPPHAYQICWRLGRARTLLRRGIRASTVAMECGFADQSHFGRHFKRALGVTPGAYAQMSHQSSTTNPTPVVDVPDGSF